VASVELGCAEKLSPTPQFIYRLLPELAYSGDCVTLEGRLPLQGFSKGAMQLQLRDDVSYELWLTNTGSGVLLSGKAQAIAYTECTRCLEEARLEIEAEVEGYYILRTRDAEVAEDDDSAEIVGSDGMVDLAIPILAALVYELPFSVLCKEDCAGLCPKCGEDLNKGDCCCIDEPDPDHPLAALRLLFPESELEGGGVEVEEPSGGGGAEVEEPSGGGGAEPSSSAD